MQTADSWETASDTRHGSSRSPAQNGKQVARLAPASSSRAARGCATSPRIFQRLNSATRRRWGKAVGPHTVKAVIYPLYVQHTHICVHLTSVHDGLLAPARRLVHNRLLAQQARDRMKQALKALLRDTVVSQQQQSASAAAAAAEAALQQQRCGEVALLGGLLVALASTTTGTAAASRDESSRSGGASQMPAAATDHGWQHWPAGGGVHPGHARSITTPRAVSGTRGRAPHQDRGPVEWQQRFYHSTTQRQDTPAQASAQQLAAAGAHDGFAGAAAAAKGSNALPEFAQREQQEPLLEHCAALAWQAAEQEQLFMGEHQLAAAGSADVAAAVTPQDAEPSLSTAGTSSVGVQDVQDGQPAWALAVCTEQPATDWLKLLASEACVSQDMLLANGGLEEIEELLRSW